MAPGRSTPLGEVRENTTADLVADTERIRERLGIEKWLVFGGSWGSTLGLAYAEAHPERCTGLILRGIFLSRAAEVLWTFGGGAQRIFPDGWAEFLSILDETEKADVLAAYHRRLNSADAGRPAAGRPRLEPVGGARLAPRRRAPAGPRGGRPGRDRPRPDRGALLRQQRLPLARRTSSSATWTRIRHLPGVIVQGRYDMVCPAVSAWDLHAAWPESRLAIVPAAGHSADEPGIVSALVDATEEFKTLA